MWAGTDRRFRGYRFPAIIIGEVVWLRFRFNLSLRDVGDLMAARGVVLSHQTVKDWCDTFGEAYAKEIPRRRPRPGDKWHLDEMVVKIIGVRCYLRRAVDQQGITLGMLVTRRRDTSAASRFLRKLLKSEQYAPRVLGTDKLRSYGAAKDASFAVPSTARARTSTTGRRTPTSGPGCANTRCGGSAHPGRLAGSAPPTTRSMGISDRGGTAWMPTPTARP